MTGEGDAVQASAVVVALDGDAVEQGRWVHDEPEADVEGQRRGVPRAGDAPHAARTTPHA